MAAVYPVMGISWYTPETWARLVAHPQAKIEKSYADMVRTVERTERHCAAHGIKTVRQTIDFDAMLAWCHCHGYEIDSRGRTAYGAMLTAGGRPDTPFVDKTRPLQ